MRAARLVEVELLDLCLAKLDALPLEPAQGPAELLLAALADHLPQERRLVGVLGGAVDEHDSVPCRDSPLQLARGHQPTGAATQDDGAASGRDSSTRRRLLRGGLLVQLPDRGREALFVELVLREDDPAVRADQDAPRHPAVGEGTKQGAVAVRDHREPELVLLLPGPTGIHRLHRADIDDLEAGTGEAFIQAAYSRRLLPTTESSRFPEDEQEPLRTGDRQPQIRHRNRAPGLDRLEPLQNLHRSDRAYGLCERPQIGSSRLSRWRWG